jgi:two-component system, LytTR family, sensor kinase
VEKKTVIKFHVIFWIVVPLFSFFNTITYIGNELFFTVLINTSLNLIYNFLTFYLFYFLISPWILNKKIILSSVFWLLYLPVSAIIISYTLYFPYIYSYPGTVPAKLTPVYWIKNTIYSIISLSTIFSILGSLSKVSLTWYRNQIKQKETEKQNISTELAMLRAQINPHFLFNTLNNIKSLTKSLPVKAIYSIDKLKGIMQYMLYESSFETVPLENEITHIINYLDLEKIRYSDPDFIDFKISGDYSGMNVPPLIFMPFIENAFKHGDKLKSAPGIIFKLIASENKILFESVNYIKDNYEQRNKNSGFGLTNIRRRLDLLFGNKYELNIVNENKTFTVKLNLIIS